MNNHPDSIALAERRVAAARTALVTELHATRTQLRRRVRSPIFIGGVLLGAIALRYFLIGRGRSQPPVHRQGAGAWTLAARTARVLLPLFLALGTAMRDTRQRTAGERSIDDDSAAE